MKAVLSLVFAFLLMPSALSRDFLPQGWFEEVPASDASIQKSYVFHTMPGVVYTVETSHDLSTWVALDEVYGLGNEHVVSMYEFTPPPPPPPGSGTQHLIHRLPKTSAFASSPAQATREERLFPGSPWTTAKRSRSAWPNR